MCVHYLCKDPKKLAPMDFPQSSLVVAEAEAGARAAVRRWRGLPEYTAMPLAPEHLAQLTAALLAPRPRISQVYLYDASCTSGSLGWSMSTT